MSVANNPAESISVGACPSRRGFLTAGTTMTAAAAFALAGCGQTGPVDPAKKLAGIKAGTTVIGLDKLPENTAAVVTVSGAHVLVARTTDTQVTAFSAICTHLNTQVVQAQSATLAQCPLHGSQFSPETGKVVRGPAAKSLPQLKVAVKGNAVVAA